MVTPNPEFVTIPEWCRRVDCSLDSGYRAARRNDIPGLFRIGRLMRVNWEAFVAATSGVMPAGTEPLSSPAAAPGPSAVPTSRPPAGRAPAVRGHTPAG